MNVAPEKEGLSGTREGPLTFDAKRIGQLFVRLTFRERSIAAALEKPETLSVKMLGVNTTAALLRAESELENVSKGFTPPPLWLAWFEHVHRETVTRLKREIADLPSVDEVRGRGPDWTGCVYISYAQEDEETAAAVVEQLRQARLIVWFDRIALEPGTDWVRASEDAILRQASAFIALISKHTAARETGHFIRERELAAKRLGREPNKRFYFPVRIDEGDPIIPATEPIVAQQFHAVRAIGGHLDGEFIKILHEIQKEFQSTRSSNSDLQ